MTERHIRITTLISSAMWTIGSLIVGIGVLTRTYGIPAIGLLFAGGGGVLNMRGYVLRCEERMRESFEMGRDYERSMRHGPGVRSVN